MPAFGIFSKIIATFSSKRLFGYAPMVFATMAIAVLGFVTWLHHFFTMGAGANVNAFFGITTMIISIPTGVKVFQLAVHNVSRPRTVPVAGSVDPWVHGYVRDRWYDGRANGGSASRFRSA